MTRIWRLRARRDDGASAVEYGLLVAAIAAIVATVVIAVGTLIRNALEDTCEGLNETASEPVDCDGTQP